jgi:hypothetical protein
METGTTGAPGGPESGGSHTPPWPLPVAYLPPLFVLVLVAGAAANLWATRGQTFIADEWAFITAYPGFDLHDMLQPIGGGGHLGVFTIILYKSLVEVGGTGNIPFRITECALLLTCGVLFFALLRPRVGDWIALGMMALLLVFGSSDEMVASTIGIAPLLGIACGLGALLCLEGESLRGDVAACLLLVLGIGTFATGLVFAAGIAVLLLSSNLPGNWRKAPDWGRLWVAAVPLGLYAIWWAATPASKHADVTSENVLSAPSSIFDSIAAGLSAISGLSYTPTDAGVAKIPLGPGYALIPVLLAATVLLVRHRKNRGFDRWDIAFAAMPFIYWMAVAAVRGVLRAPDIPRYQILTFVLLGLLYAQLVRGMRISRAATAIFAVLLGLALIGNLGSMRAASQLYRVNSQENLAELTALSVVRDTVSPGFLVEAPSSPNGALPDMLVPASGVLQLLDNHGTPAPSVSELTGEPPYVRTAADKLMIRALGAAPRPASPGAAPPVGDPPSVGPLLRASATPRGSCVRITPTGGGGAVAVLALRQGDATVSGEGGAPQRLALRRFGDAFIPLAPIPSGKGQVVPLAADRSTRPWLLEVITTAPATVCSAGRPARP